MTGLTQFLSSILWCQDLTSLSWWGEDTPITTMHNGCECAHSTDGVSGRSITYRSHRWQKLMKPCLSSSKCHAFHTSPYHLLWTLSLPPRGINHFSEDSHIHNWVLFLLRLHPFILSGVISPLISSSILGTYRPGEFIFQCPIFSPFQTVHGVLKARILMWFVIPFSSGPHSVRPLNHDPAILGGPTQHGLVSLS